MNTETKEGMDLGKEIGAAEAIKAQSEGEHRAENFGYSFEELMFIRKLNTTALWLVGNELEAANRKYAPLYFSSNEALGTIHAELQEVEDILKRVKVVNGLVLKGDSEDFKKLKIELAHLALSCVKGMVTFCDLDEDLKIAEAVSLEQQTILAAVANLPDEQPTEDAVVEDIPVVEEAVQDGADLMAGEN